MKLHEWIYEIVNEICYDREYVYAAFVRHFSSLMDEIINEGKCKESGIYTIPGIKSGLQAKLTWVLEHRINWSGLNVVRISCTIGDLGSGIEAEERVASFELSSGELVG